MPRSQIPITTVESAVLSGYGYDPTTSTMVLRFQSNGAQREYEYPDTAPESFASLDAAESKGSWWFKNKKNFPTYRIMEEDPKPADSEGGEAA